MRTTRVVKLYHAHVSGRDPWDFYVVATSWKGAIAEAELSLSKGERISRIDQVSDRVVLGEDV